MYVKQSLIKLNANFVVYLEKQSKVRYRLTAKSYSPVFCTWKTIKSTCGFSAGSHAIQQVIFRIVLLYFK